jgi:hypothetical protein
MNPCEPFHRFQLKRLLITQEGGKEMKKSLLLGTLFSPILVASSMSISHAHHAITQLTNNSYEDANPQINNDGKVVWYGYDGSDTEIFLYDGISVSQITDNSVSDLHPHLGAHGKIVWRGGDGSESEIFLYDGTSITQITNNTDPDPFPWSNDKDELV